MSESSTATHTEISAEQSYVDGLFARLDNEVQSANERLNEVQAAVDPHTPDADALVRRETEYHGLQAKLDRLNVAQLGLVFGRIDIDAPGDNPTPEGLDRRYIGRMGLDAREEDYRTLLLDWRAPMARPFYLATTAHPEGVHVRRHIRTTGRTVTALAMKFWKVKPALKAAMWPANLPCTTSCTVPAPGTCRPSWRPSNANRMRSFAIAPVVSWSSKAALAPARRRWRCTE